MSNTLINLPITTINADGSTSVFGSGGNAISTLEPDGSSLVYATPNYTTATTAPIWFAPPPSTTMLNTIMSGGAGFQSTLNGVTVFKLYEVMLTLPDATLKSFFSYLNSHHISLAIEGMPLVATAGQPGYGVESFSENPSDLQTLLTKIKNDGGNLSYVAWDEPWYYGYYSTGIDSLSQVASQVAASTEEVKALFPNAKVGDIEPVGGSPTETALLQSWFTAYANASGSQFSFFQEDIGGWIPGWQTTLGDVTAMARANGMQVGAIIDGSWNAASNQAWSTQAVSMAQQIMSDPSVRPDFLVVQSWQTYPSEATNPNQAGTLASVAQDVENGMRSAMAVPAVARYDASRMLQSVAWSGGWTVSSNGTNVDAESPTGAIIAQVPVSSVRAAAFQPTSGTLTLTVSVAPATSTQPEQDATYSISVAAGQFVFTTLASSATTTASALTTASATPSATLSSGAGVVGQSAPTFGLAAAPQQTSTTGANPLFDASWYLTQIPNASSTAQAAYDRYTAGSWREGSDLSPSFSNPSSGFNAVAYVAANSSVPAGAEPVAAVISGFTNGNGW